MKQSSMKCLDHDFWDWRMEQVARTADGDGPDVWLISVQWEQSA